MKFERTLVVIKTLVMVSALFILLLPTSCSEIAEKHNRSINQLSDTIKEACVIFVSPSIEKTDSLKKVNEDDFYIAADDNLYYIGNARYFLDSINFKTIDVDSKNEIIFRQKNGIVNTVNLTDFYWGIILFNSVDTPKIADITVFETEFKSYMNQ
jgi:hypothetical protein